MRLLYGSSTDRQSAGGEARAAVLTAAERREIAEMGGKARAAQMTPEERKAVAKKAAEARWKK
jgi:hypothetical protein